MHKFYWNNQHQSRSGARGGHSSNSSSSSSSNNNNNSRGAPEIPNRPGGVTVKVTQPDSNRDVARCCSSHRVTQQLADTIPAPPPPAGSHRVLLRLRRMSGGAAAAAAGGGQRPKSVTDETLAENSVHERPRTSGNCRMRTSKSAHHFHNRTWNERSLRQNQHNYENIYREEKYLDEISSNLEHNYENVDMTMVDFAVSTPIERLSSSPGAARRAKKEDDEDEGETSSVTKSKKSTRSKSCERPKMRDAFKNLNRFSSNFTEKFISKLNNHHHNSHSHKNQSAMIHSRTVHSLLHSEAESHFPFFDDDEDYSGLRGEEALQGHHRQKASPNCEDSCSISTQGDDQDKLSLRSSTSNLSRATISAAGPSSSALAVRMRDLRQSAQRQIARMRSRSAERIGRRRNRRRSSNEVPTHLPPSGAILPTPPAQRHQHQLLQQQRERQQNGPCASLPSSTSSPSTYAGPFLGRARALVDYTPSPYDRDALRFKRGDEIDIISMNPSGLWKGRCQGRTGNFKFINVEVLPERISQKKRSRSNSRGRRRVQSQQVEPSEEEQEQNRPKTVEDLLRRNGLESYLSVFVLNGYEDLDSFADMDESELDYLGIEDQRHRAKIMTAVEIIQDYAAFHSGEESDDDDDHSSATPTHVTSGPPVANAAASTASSGSLIHPFRRLSFPRDSGCYASGEDPISRLSPTASDRSSHSGVSSHPESGIGVKRGPEEEEEQPGEIANAEGGGSSSDEDTVTDSSSISPVKRPAEQSARARSLRDRRAGTAVNSCDVKLSSNGNSSSSSADSGFEALVEKYERQRNNFESSFNSAKRVFEKKNVSPSKKSC